MRRQLTIGIIATLLLLPATAWAGDTATATNASMIGTVWLMVAGFLVFFMNAGFALVESGFCRSKNTVNIMAKNFMVFAIASIAFYVMGYALMMGDGGLVGTTGFLLSGLKDGDVPAYATFFFQLVFAATAATIVSGAVAERIKLIAFILFAAVLVALVYPVVGHWIWYEKGFLAKAGFADYAGSTVVHSVGGWAALAGIIFLGPRIGKYDKNGKARPIPGHSMALSTLGALVLWLGWYGFNGGAATKAGDLAWISLTTTLGASSGVVSATILAWILFKKPDLSMILNGSLAGLVAVTAGCAYITPNGALVIGLVAGVLVVFSVLLFDKLRLDDPVGAVSVHLINGVWGTLAVGFFAAKGLDHKGLFYGGGLKLLGAQLYGIAVVGVFVMASASIVWLALKHTIGIRVHEEEELVGLDISEHGMEAYPKDTYVPGSPTTRTGSALSQMRVADLPEDLALALTQMVTPQAPE